MKPHRKNKGKYSQVRAVVLDYGQVICLRPGVKLISRMAEAFRIDDSQFLEWYAASRGPYDQGLVSSEEYWRSIAGTAKIEIDSGLIERLRKWDTEMWSRINARMIEWLRMLHHGGFTTALLSNMQADMAAYAREKFGWLSNFDHQIFSCDLGLIKPDPAIFHECLRRIRVPATEVLFVDDRQENVVAAEAIGMWAIQFKSLKQLRVDLQRAGFHVLPRERKAPMCSSESKSRPRLQTIRKRN